VGTVIFFIFIDFCVGNCIYGLDLGFGEFCVKKNYASKNYDLRWKICRRMRVGRDDRRVSIDDDSEKGF